MKLRDRPRSRAIPPPPHPCTGTGAVIAALRCIGHMRPVQDKKRDSEVIFRLDNTVPPPWQQGSHCQQVAALSLRIPDSDERGQCAAFQAYDRGMV